MSQNVKKLSGISACFPCYNEEGNIRELIESSSRILLQFAESVEIIIVNDGSTDKTSPIAHEYQGRIEGLRIIDKPNGGYGSAVKAGLEAGQLEWILLCDGDLQFNLEELIDFLPFATAYDLICGKRIKRAEGIKRRVTQELHRLWSIILLGLPPYIKDINCAFKLMRREVVQGLLPLQSEGAMVSTELLLRAHKKGARFVHVPVTHLQRKFGAPTGAKPGVIGRAVRETLGLIRL